MCSLFFRRAPSSNLSVLSKTTVILTFIFLFFSKKSSKLSHGKSFDNFCRQDESFLVPVSRRLNIGDHSEHGARDHQ
jgi:hypothetical protein